MLRIHVELVEVVITAVALVGEVQVVNGRADRTNERIGYSAGSIPLLDDERVAYANPCPFSRASATMTSSIRMRVANSFATLNSTARSHN